MRLSRAVCSCSNGTVWKPFSFRQWTVSVWFLSLHHPSNAETQTYLPSFPLLLLESHTDSSPNSGGGHSVFSRSKFPVFVWAVIKEKRSKFCEWKKCLSCWVSPTTLSQSIKYILCIFFLTRDNFCFFVLPPDLNRCCICKHWFISETSPRPVMLKCADIGHATCRGQSCAPQRQKGGD